MSTPGEQAADRSRQEGDRSDKVKPTTDTQSCMNDGLGIMSRLSGLLTVSFIAFFLAAIFVENWSASEDQITSSLGSIGLDVSGNVNMGNTSDVKYSLDSYCIKAKVPAWNNAEHQVCFKYMENVNFCDEDGLNCEKLTGCERFGNICYVRQVVKLSLAVAIIIGIVAGTFSEKGFPTTSGLQFLAMIGGIVAMGMWVDWSQRELGDDVSKLKLGLGGWLITIGWLLAFLAFLTGLLDHYMCCCCKDAPKKQGLMNDGIGYASRAASFLSVGTWICLLVAVSNPAWTAVDNLGNVGNFSSAAGGNTSGTFGIWMYCIDEYVPQFGLDAKHAVCLDWNDKIALTDSEEAAACALSDAADAAALMAAGEVLGEATKELGSGLGDDDDGEAGAASSSDAACGTSGLDRFASFGLINQRRLTGFMILASALSAIITDLYSEKNWVGSIFMFISAVTAMIGFASWVNFQFKLHGKNGDATGLTFDEGGWVVVGAWIGAFISFLLYFKAYRNPIEYSQTSVTVGRRSSKSHV